MLTYEGEIWAEKELKCLQCPAWNSMGYIMPCGNEGTDIVVVGDAPTQPEVLQNKSFAGPAGGLLKKYLTNEEGLFYINACRCCPPEDKKVEAAKCCRNKMYYAVRSCKDSKAVLCIGGLAATSIINSTSKKAIKITELAGKEKFTDVGKTLFSIHPAAVLKGGYDEAKFSATLKFIQKIARGEETRSALITTTDIAVVPPGCPVAFDTETRGLEAYKADLVGSCASWDGINVHKSFDIPEYLFDTNRLIIGHNLPFDLSVAYTATGKEILGNLFDTRVAHHLIDERPPHTLS
jgi:uracil-DNA glycosylase family 4